MGDWKELPFSGINCDKSTGVCSIWWVQSKLVDNKTKTKSIRVDIPDYKLIAGTSHKAELKLADTFKDSILSIE